MTYTFADFKSGKPIPRSWDAADAVEDGWTADDIDGFMLATGAGWLEPRPSEAQRPEGKPVDRDDLPAGSPKLTKKDASDTAVLTRQLDRRVIQYVECDLPRVVNMACAEAVKSGADLYARGTSLVRPVTIHNTTAGRGVKRADGATVLVPVEKAALVEILTDVIRWKRWDGRKDDWKPVACPPIVAETMLARRGDWPFPQLNAVVSAPTMRPDGTILNMPGFDHDTGILFASELTWPHVPDSPAMEEASDALRCLGDLVEDFPFVDASDRAAALAMILTALARSCLPSAPMFCVNAPTPGTGKSKLVDIAAILATGQTASVLSVPREEAEMHKQLGATLMAGDGFITLDNIEYPLRSEFLCQVLTQGSVAVRVLGESRTMKLPTCATFCATGNSLRIAGDLTRRVVMINLDAGVERPEERMFDVDVIEMARKQRVRLVTAGLTILRAFVAHRGQKIVPALGSFEGWSNLVRSAVMWLGEADPLGNAEKVRENDPERERTAAILSALPAGRDWTAKEIGQLIQPDRGFNTDLREHEALADAVGEFIERNGQFNALRFGHFLKKHQWRIIDGRRIVPRGKDRNKIALWAVEDLSEF